MVILTPQEPSLQGLYRLELHDAVFQGLVEDGAIVDGYMTPEQLESWADRCDNPHGQRAAVVRAIAQLRRLGPLTVRNA